MRNIIDAIITLVEQSEKNLFNDNKKSEVNGYYDLETYVKNIFANAFDCENDDERRDKLSNTFIYLGNSTNPPDLILKSGDAIEVKKVQPNYWKTEFDGKVLLNSVYPRKFLNISDPLLTKSCREAEKWTKKDIIYAVGISKERKLKHFCMVYGCNYCASDEYYKEICYQIQEGLKNIQNVSFPYTREFGRVEKIDPLKSTLVRIIGQWQIESPWKIFNYIYNRSEEADFTFMCLIDDIKWNQLNNVNELMKLQSNYKNLKISDVKIKNPDNPKILENAKLITHHIEVV